MRDGITYSLLRILAYVVCKIAQIAANIGSTQNAHIQRLGFERRPPDEQRVEDAADCPHVDLIRVASFHQHFGRNVIWRATKRLLLLAFKADFCCESKIADFYDHVVVEEEIAELKIAMYDVNAVQIHAAFNNLKKQQFA